MKLTPKIEKAVQKASSLHQKQLRKGQPIPYISHLFSVAIILSEFTDDENIIAAGILHDAIEDTNYTAEELENDFGSEVKKMVLGVSEEKYHDGVKIGWQERKQKYLQCLKDDDFGSLMVCVADKIHNLMSLMNDYKIKGEQVWDNFNASKEKKMWYYGETLKIIGEKLNNPIVEKYIKVYEEAIKVFGTNK